MSANNCIALNRKNDNGRALIKKLLIFWLLIFAQFQATAQAQERLRLATTTSTDNSGLLAVLHPPFEKQYGVKIDVIAVGTGKALKLGENGDVDVVMVHAPGAEIKFVEAGYGVERLAVMYNDFILLGPVEDPAMATRADTITAALIGIAGHEQTFISRGDDSGTHKKEKSLWQKTGIKPAGEWYLAVGQGMGATLRIADDKQAYTLSDRGTYLAYKDKISLVVTSEGDPELVNPYHVIMVNPAKRPHVKTGLARKYITFIRGEKGRDIIRNFKKFGERLFNPGAAE